MLVAHVLEVLVLYPLQLMSYKFIDPKVHAAWVKENADKIRFMTMMELRA